MMQFDLTGVINREVDLPGNDLENIFPAMDFNSL